MPHRLHGIFVLLLLVLLCAGGCSIRSHGNSGRMTVLKSGGVSGAGTRGMYVAMPQDFTGENGSGKRMQNVLMDILKDGPGRKVAAPAYLPQPQRLEAAKSAQCGLLLTVDILDWQDPPAAFQYKPDRGVIEVSVYDTESGDLLRKDALECSSGATTVNLIGFHDPGDCLTPALKKWRDALGADNSAGK